MQYESTAFIQAASKSRIVQTVSVIPASIAGVQRIDEWMRQKFVLAVMKGLNNIVNEAVHLG